MSSVFVAVLMILAVMMALGGFLWMVARRTKRPAGTPDPALALNFDIQRYRPMQRLLAGDDAAFLAGSGAFARAELARWRTERRRLFARYLKNLEFDFDRLHLAAREVLILAAEDRPDLATSLMSQQWMFRKAIWTIRLKLYVPGFGTAAQEVSRAVAALESMRNCLTAAPVTAGQSAA